MGQRTWDQATGLLNLIKQTGWDSDMVQVLFKNWGLYRELTEALRVGHIAPDDIRLFLDGKAAKSTAGRVINIRPYVELMIKAGYHKATNGGEGMPASKYRKLWPKTVIQPVEYSGRFDEVLLVDYAITLPELVRSGKIDISVRPPDCVDLVKASIVSRYIAFVQLGKKNRGRPVEDCTKTLASDEVSLVTIEGLHLPIQHAAYLRNYAVDLAGSRYGSVGAPYVRWFGIGRPHFGAASVRDGIPGCGSASRGIKVISVT